MYQRCSETPQFMTTEWDIRIPPFCRWSLLQAIYPTRLWFIQHNTLYLLWFTTMFVHKACQGEDLHPWMRIWLDWVANSSPNNTVTTIQNHRIIVQELPLAKAVDLTNSPSNIIPHKGMVTRFHSSLFLALSSIITILHSTWHMVRHQPPAKV